MHTPAWNSWVSDIKEPLWNHSGYRKLCLTRKPLRDISNNPPRPQCSKAFNCALNTKFRSTPLNFSRTTQIIPLVTRWLVLCSATWPPRSSTKRELRSSSYYIYSNPRSALFSQSTCGEALDSRLTWGICHLGGTQGLQGGGHVGVHKFPYIDSNYGRYNLKFDIVLDSGKYSIDLCIALH